MIWKWRNEFVYESKIPNPIEVLQKISIIQNDYFSHWVSQSRVFNIPVSGSNCPTVWRPPDRGVTKLNIDASYNDQKKIAYAGIIARDDKGDMVAGLTRKFPATSPLMAEALNFRESIAFAENMGMANIIVESDCLELIQSCRKEVVRGEIFNIVQDILLLKDRFVKAAFTWIARDGNQPSHHVALLASQNLLHANWV